MTRPTFIPISNFESQPPTEWIIQGVLPARSVAILFGPSTAGKSFLALDWSFHIATGRDWQDRATKQGGIAYIYAEGQEGVGKRVRAWRQYNGYDGQLDVWLLPGSVKLTDDAGVTQLIADLQALPVPPAVVMIDTLHQNMVGSDENSAKETSVVIANAKLLRDTLRTAVVFVHHTGWKNTDRLRGSSSLFADADVVFGLRERSSTETEAELVLEGVKQRDDRKADLNLRRLEVVLPDGQTSCVIDAGSRSASADLRDGTREILRTLGLGDGPLAPKELRAITGLSESTLKRRLGELTCIGYVERSSYGTYTLTPRGRTWAADSDPAATTTAATPATDQSNRSKLVQWPTDPLPKTGPTGPHPLGWTGGLVGRPVRESRHQTRGQHLTQPGLKGRQEKL